MALTRPPRPTAGTWLKRAVFLLVLLGTALAALVTLRLSSQVFARYSRAAVQVDALFLARRPPTSATLAWRAGPAGARQPDGVTLEDIRQAYLLAFSELTYAHRSGDGTGLPGRLSGEALRGAVQATAPRSGALLLDWAHRAVPLGLRGQSFELEDDLWTLRALPGPGGWPHPVIRRETRRVSLAQAGGVWRVVRWRILSARPPAPQPAPPLPVHRWRAVTVDDWSDWTREDWAGTVRRVRQAGLGPLVLRMPEVPTVNTGRALRLGVQLAAARGLEVAVEFGSPFTLEALPGRVTAGLQARGAVALLPGPLPQGGQAAQTGAALAALRAAQPVPLITEGAGPPGAAAFGSGRLGRADEPGTLRRVPAAPRLPWKRRAFQAELAGLPARGWVAPSLDALVDARGQLTPLGAALLRRGQPR